MSQSIDNCETIIELFTLVNTKLMNINYRFY